MVWLLVFVLLLVVHPFVNATDCYDPDTFCSNSWIYSPSTCDPDLSTALPDVYKYCLENDPILWKKGIEDGTSTATNPVIDYNFLICMESFSVCGYVPLNGKSSSDCGQVLGQSGVTFGAGIDLGHQTTATLSELGATEQTLDKLDDYIELTGSTAAEKICNQPFTVNSTIAYNMTIKLMDQYANRVEGWYNDQRNTSNTISFDQLPLGIRTVLTSIHWRWGWYTSYPTFWGYIISNDFESATSELRAWYESGATDERLSKEANIMEASLGCTQSHIDCVFLLDESGSVGQDNYDTAIDWIIEFIESFDGSIGVNGTRFGISTFSSSYTERIYLNEYATLDDYKTHIASIDYDGGGTALGDALTQIGEDQFTETNGMRPLIDGIPRVLIVMTDGISYDDVADGVDTLGDLNLNIIAIGIAGYDIDQLRDITSDDNIYTLDSFDGLQEILDGITTQTCYVPTQLQLGEDNVVQIEDIESVEGQTLYFQFSTSTDESDVNLDENIILNITQTDGCVYVYVSYCTLYPSYFVNDISFTSCEQSFKQIILAPTSQCGANQTQSVSIFIAFEGHGDSDEDDTNGENVFGMIIDTCNNSVCDVGTNYDPSLDTDDPYSIDDVIDDEPSTTIINNTTITKDAETSKSDNKKSLYAFATAIIIAFVIVLG